LKPTKLVLVWALFLCLPLVASAQDAELHRRPPSRNDSVGLPSKPEPVGALTASAGGVNAPEELPRSMVRVSVRESNGYQWVAREQGTCEWCGKPMSFKQAAFDKKMSLMWIAEIGLAVADTEITESRPCMKNGTCKEGNPLLGASRAQQYGIRMPVIFGAWMASAYLRHGNPTYKIGGMKHWWVLPTLYHAASTIGIVANLAR
jgi:hypothetical protein